LNLYVPSHLRESVRRGRIQACVWSAAVAERIPATLARLLDGVLTQGRRDSSRRSVVEENAHQRPGRGASRLRAANSRTALI